tara:strand:+ start:2024 stop:3070 length:1047 start_codon:yes stop_codon:yes gene_type:complete
LRIWTAIPADAKEVGDVLAGVKFLGQHGPFFGESFDMDEPVEFRHQPVLVEEVIKALQPISGGKYLDGTLGGGGHAEAILRVSSPEGILWGIDRDQSAIEAASSRLAAFGNRVKIKHGAYSSAVGWVTARTMDGVLLDLGVSSPQLDFAERGFSLQTEGPLDMRMDRTQSLTAVQVINEWPEEDLADAIWKFGGERDSRRIARSIVRAREEKTIETTTQLSALIEKAKRYGKYKKHPALQVFQAIRIVVNGELCELGKGLEMAYGLLKSGGRLAVITFHSLEDRMVKEYGNEQARDYDIPGDHDVPVQRVDREPYMKWVCKKSIKPSTNEIKTNPRARSAQLRVLEKI